MWLVNFIPNNLNIAIVNGMLYFCYIFYLLVIELKKWVDQNEDMEAMNTCISF